MESWRTCTRNNRYEVSDLGRVRHTLTGRVKSAHSGGGSTGRYLRVSLVSGNRKAGTYKVRPHNVHTLVLEAFAGPAAAGHVCRHLDGDPTNNALSNLEWGTPLQNARDQHAHGTHKGVQLEAVVPIREAFAQGASAKDLARQHGVTVSTIYCIARGATYRELPGPRTRGPRGLSRPEYAARRDEIRRLRATGMDRRDIEERLGVSRHVVGRALRTRTTNRAVPRNP